MSLRTSGRARVRLVALVAAASAVAAGLSAAPALAATAATPRAHAAATAAAAEPTTLVTGDRVFATAATGPGPASYAVQRAQASGPGSVVHTYRVGSDTYVVPAVAQRYLGTTLDPSLFDVTALTAAEHASGRLAVAISHTGALRALPGVTVTADRAGVATGYLTAASAPAFGAALVTQWLADEQAGPTGPTGPTGSGGLFAGIGRIAAASAPPSVTPNFPMHTLRVTGIDAQGQPEQFGFGILVNVDNAAKYGGFVQLVNGQARVSVPTGHYAAVFDDFTVAPNGRTTDATATIPTYLVSGDGQTLTYDMRHSTVAAKVTVLEAADVEHPHPDLQPHPGARRRRADVRCGRHRRGPDQPDGAGDHRQPGHPDGPDRCRWSGHGGLHLRRGLQPRVGRDDARRPRDGGRHRDADRRLLRRPTGPHRLVRPRPTRRRFRVVLPGQRHPRLPAHRVRRRESQASAGTRSRRRTPSRSTTPASWTAGPTSTPVAAPSSTGGSRRRSVRASQLRRRPTSSPSVTPASRPQRSR